MDIIHTETNCGKKSIIYYGYSYRKVNSLKNRDVVFRCSTGKSCKATVTTDEKGVAVVKMKNEHNYESYEKNVEVKQLRVRIRKQSGDITSRPSKIIRQEIQIQGENLLKTNDLRNLAQSLFRERRKDLPKLPKNRGDVHNAFDVLDLNTNKDERFMARNSRETGIVIFTCVTNLKCLSDQIKDIFIDGTFKCCPKFFLQLYTIHGCENGNYVPLVFVLLPSKTEICYDQMWYMFHYMCREREV
jgi:hypothetical protein